MDNQNTPFSENMKQPTLAGLFIILLIGAVIGFQLGKWSVKQDASPIYPTRGVFPSEKVCTQEAKLCPNGSYVGRTGPNCEFAPCPTADLSAAPTSVVKDGCVRAGCSSELCVDQSQADIVTTCELKEEYSCLNSSICEKQPDGECGWTQTPQYLQCLTNYK
ncbi:hypothetical protein A3C98_00610 [Candidatus Roizmanbacteria bacterium RIFCSPHIGHO2_02_FULL_37_15]|uniref:Kazal-like domain-containing protein n=1 Tax=Candidatus Roizmanbacteria bacterium RIFCSPLOWO2_01_FULL_37_16 TaxID=1802058 RepID=A0A1F7INM0_9BACT|nr:MAG: hypothetical protein A2859_02265 [Candidatus Roizmanbacteria bacterium RIFCSPHIGHO2_01_FULL_37_16b]OGK22781.1 MAG: hypothetical protein A3C98_00610 [Candidatus Roizmanbacteria bacterium RIFCSPHIGHO2_02_FULL_37_15]OGK34091.1 MAG: hypothetical protein A3F57_05330 [Candidatus Roizmanbacteria bacterium RIFCSPHIGHO2_12_FULL_36_11]OGK44921.1 MAG: hypothetical protein A3B40_00120 [Candidatus Roizmanbacteria bacterium RIFCSPLOWO2_01_FULL_37_16]OGK57494.1 MAG: hypothetical protein A3I50_05600 [C